MFGDVSVAGMLFIRFYRDQIAKQISLNVFRPSKYDSLQVIES